MRRVKEATRTRWILVIGAVATVAGLVVASIGSTETRAQSVPDGRAIYARCATCHQATGLGMPGSFPPLAGSEWALDGDGGKAARIVLHGLQGPIVVRGKRYESVMPAYGTGQPLSDAEIAAVLTYVRTSFGNHGSAVTAATVARERAATSSRKTLWTARELGAPR